MNVILPIPTAGGNYLALYNDEGLQELRFPHQPSVELNTQPTASQKSWHTLTTLAVSRVLEGRSIQKLPPFSLQGTDFQKSVWLALQNISLGKTSSYGEIAKTIGRPKATRAVGSACGSNPIPLLIPCHRVLAFNGKLGGFSGGLEIKIQLLAVEGLHFT